MAFTNIDTTDTQDAFLADAANDTYKRHGVAEAVITYVPVGIDSVDAFAAPGLSADTLADIADAYARDKIGCPNGFDRHGIPGMSIKHATYNAGRTVNRVI